MKKISSIICCTLLSSVLLTPFAGGVTAADYNGWDTVKDPYEEALGINVLVNSDTLNVYEMEEDGVLYRYVETVTATNGQEEINVEKFEVNDSQRTLVDEYSTLVINDTNSNSIIVQDETGERISISKDLSVPDGGETSPDASYKGSYISDVRYRYTSSTQAQAIMAGQSPYYKNVSRTNINFVRFQGHADNLKAYERNLLTFGVLGFADDIVRIVKSGKVLNYSTVKFLLKNTVRVGVVSTIMHLIIYGQEWSAARTDYRRI